MRGRNQLITCCYCGRRVPRDKASRINRSNFRYHDERMGIKYFGGFETDFCCPSCARHRGVSDLRPRKGRPKKR